MAWWARMGQLMPLRDLGAVVVLEDHQAHHMNWPRKIPRGTTYKVSSGPVPAWTRAPRLRWSWAWGG